MLYTIIHTYLRGYNKMDTRHGYALATFVLTMMMMNGAARLWFESDYICCANDTACSIPSESDPESIYIATIRVITIKSMFVTIPDHGYNGIMCGVSSRWCLQYNVTTPVELIRHCLLQSNCTIDFSHLQIPPSLTACAQRHGVYIPTTIGIALHVWRFHRKIYSEETLNWNMCNATTSSLNDGYITFYNRQSSGLSQGPGTQTVECHCNISQSNFPDYDYYQGFNDSVFFIYIDTLVLLGNNCSDELYWNGGSRCSPYASVDRALMYTSEPIFHMTINWKISRRSAVYLSYETRTMTPVKLSCGRGLVPPV